MPAWKKLGLLPAGCVGVGASAGCTALLCLALTPLFTKEYISLDRAELLAPMAAGIAVFAVAWVLTRRRGRQTLATSGIVAGGYILLAALVCALGGRDFGFGPWLGRLVLAVGAGALLGAIMSLRATPGKKRPKHRG